MVFQFYFCIYTELLLTAVDEGEGSQLEVTTDNGGEEMSICTDSGLFSDFHSSASAAGANSVGPMDEVVKFLGSSWSKTNPIKFWVSVQW